MSQGNIVNFYEIQTINKILNGTVPQPANGSFIFDTSTNGFYIVKNSNGKIYQLNSVNNAKFDGVLSAEHGGTGVASEAELYNKFSSKRANLTIDAASWSAESSYYLCSVKLDDDYSNYQLIIDINLAEVDPSQYADLLSNYQKIARIYPDNSNNLILHATSQPNRDIPLSVLAIRVSTETSAV